MKIKVIFLILLSLLCITSAIGQKKNKKIVVTGMVTDVLQKPLVGAMVLIDGRSTNRTTNNNGIFKLKVPPDADSITIVTFTNGISTVAIKGRTNINFILAGLPLSQQNAKNMQSDNKQVNIGYGNVDQKNLVTSVSTVDGKNHKYAAYKDIYEILRGIAGVEVHGNSVQIRGQSSFMGSTEPLFIIDGVTVQSIDGISPTLVESISVLKGSSASIYGSRGANGVILISLIKGY